MTAERTFERDYEDLLESVADGEGYYLECEEGHAGLPPQRVCSECGSTEFTRSQLPETGELKSYSVIRVAANRFVEDTPYTIAIAEFGPVRLTGHVREVEPESVSADMTVTVDVESSKTSSDPLIVFHPAGE